MSNENHSEMTNSLGNWKPRQSPDFMGASGRHVAIAPVRFPDDGQPLFEAIAGSGNDDLWRYIPIGPFNDADTMVAGLEKSIVAQNWQTHLLRDVRTGEVLGMASFMRIRPDHGSVEVGCIIYSRRLQQTPAATEAMYLMARHIFETRGYRRYEWKCNDANGASKRAALRLGFTYEGTFRNDQIVKGANRDTAWYSITDAEWPVVKRGFEAWLSPDNFDDNEQQRKSLAALRE